MADAAEEIIEDRGDELTPEQPVEEAPEVEETPEVEPQAEPDEGTQEEVVEEKPAPSIPKSRFDEVNSKRKEAEDRLRDLETKLAVMEDRQKRAEPEPEPEPKFDFDAKEQEYMDAVLDGDSGLAKSIRQEIRAAERNEYMAEVNQYKEQINSVADTAKAKTLEELNFERVANTLVSDYAELNQQSDKFNEGMLNEIVELKDAYISSGMSSDAALEKAGNIIMRGAHKVSDAPPQQKKTTDVEKNIETAKRQPPMQEAGESNGTTGEFDISKLSDKDWDALPESKLKELRGDYL